MLKAPSHKTSSPSLWIMVVTLLIAVFMLTGCQFLGLSTGKTQPKTIAPPPKILGSGTLVNDYQLSAQGMQTSFAMHMVTAQVGWGLQSKDMGGTIYRTTDGGKSWKRLPLPSDLASLPYYLYSFDETMAFLVPMNTAGYPHPLLYFYGTTNGGTSWQRHALPTTPVMTGTSATFKWTFLDHNQGWVTASPNMVGGCGGGRPVPMQPVAYEVLFHTTDGGQHWQKVSQLPFKYDINGLSFIDSHTGWLAAEIDDPKHPFPDMHDYPSTLFVTHDGGLTWIQQSLTLPSQEANQPATIQPTFSTTQDGNLFVTFHDGDDLRITRIYQYSLQARSATWMLNGPVLPAAADGTYGTLTWLDRTHVVENGYTSSPDQSVAYSSLLTLQKNTWVTTTMPNTYQNFIVQLFSPQTGVALAVDSDNNLATYKVSDSGKTWIKIGNVP